MEKVDVAFNQATRKEITGIPAKIRTVACIGAFAVLTGIGLTLWSCAAVPQKPEIDLRDGVHFDVYDSGRIVHSGSLSKDSPPVMKLDKLVHDDAATWSRSYLTFAPGIAFEGERFSITLQQRKMIVNYKDPSGKLEQVVRDLPEGAFAEIKSDLATER